PRRARLFYEKIQVRCAAVYSGLCARAFTGIFSQTVPAHVQGQLQHFRNKAYLCSMSRDCLDFASYSSCASRRQNAPWSNPGERGLTRLAPFGFKGRLNTSESFRKALSRDKTAAGCRSFQRDHDLTAGQFLGPERLPLRVNPCMAEPVRSI